MEADNADELACFLCGELDPSTFRHADHVRLAFALLREQGFLASLLPFANGIKQMASKAGKLDSYNETITTAFLSLIAERAVTTEADNYASFAHSNAELFDKNLLLHYYHPDRLQSKVARATFVLPSAAYNRAI